MNGEPRVVTDADATQWSCIEASAAKLADDNDAVPVVCTPSGGAQSVRLDLPADWDELPDAELVAAITEARTSNN